ncbi:MAG: hypothetical protein AAFZ15_33845 [Bacteroidota bacterium]
MNTSSKKSVMDFKGQAMPKSQQIAVKGGNVNQGEPSGIIIIDDILDG